MIEGYKYIRGICNSPDVCKFVNSKATRGRVALCFISDEYQISNASLNQMFMGGGKFLALFVKMP